MIKMSVNKYLKSVAHNIAHSYLSTYYFFDGGYMGDWLYNLAITHGIEKIEISVLDDKVTPSLVDINPLKLYLPDIRKVLYSSLAGQNIDKEHVQSAVMEFSFDFSSQNVFCNSKLTDKNAVVHPGKAIIEKSHEQELWNRVLPSNRKYFEKD